MPIDTMSAIILPTSFISTVTAFPLSTGKEGSEVVETELMLKDPRNFKTVSV